MPTPDTTHWGCRLIIYRMAKLSASQWRAVNWFVAGFSSQSWVSSEAPALCFPCRGGSKLLGTVPRTLVACKSIGSSMLWKCPVQVQQYIQKPTKHPAEQPIKESKRSTRHFHPAEDETRTARASTHANEPESVIDSRAEENRAGEAQRNHPCHPNELWRDALSLVLELPVPLAVGRVVTSAGVPSKLWAF